MSINLDALEALANKATPGPWRCQTTTTNEGEDAYCIKAGGAVFGEWLNDECDGVYIAACDPQTIKALIARYRAADSLAVAARDFQSNRQISFLCDPPEATTFARALAAYEATKEAL